MPSNFGLVLTTRPDVQVPKLDKFEPIQLKQDDALNKQDIRAFIQFKLGSGVDSKVLDVLESSSNGLFLYAMFACNQLLQDKSSNVDLFTRAKKLPNGIFGIYIDYFSTLLKESFNNNIDWFICSCLAPVLASRVPLPYEIWKVIVISKVFPVSNLNNKSEQLKINREFESKIKGPLLRLLDFSGGFVTVLHKSMDDPVD